MRIDIDNESRLAGQTFRVAAFANAACSESLWCRIDWHDDDWRLTFYESHREADHDWKPMQSLKGSQIALAQKAMAYVAEWITQNCDG